MAEQREDPTMKRLPNVVPSNLKFHTCSSNMAPVMDDTNPTPFAMFIYAI